MFESINPMTHDRSKMNIFALKSARCIKSQAGPVSSCNMRHTMYSPWHIRNGFLVKGVLKMEYDMKGHENSEMIYERCFILYFFLDLIVLFHFL